MSGKLARQRLQLSILQPKKGVDESAAADLEEVKKTKVWFLGIVNKGSFPKSSLSI